MEQEEKVTRVIDFKIPLPYLITGIIAVGGLLINNHFTLQQVVKDLNGLQTTAQTGTTNSQQVNAELAMLKYRLETLESVARQTNLQPTSRKP